MRKIIPLLTALVLLIGGAEVFSQTNPVSPSEQALRPSKPAPVILDGKILFYIKTGLLSFTAQDRALRVYQNPTAGEEGWRTGGKEPEK